MTREVVIVGGGFGGVELARQLRRRGGPAVRVTLINEQNYTTFSPMLPEVVSATVLPGQVVAPLRQVLGGGDRFIMGRVIDVDVAARRLTYDCGEAQHELAFDEVVVAVGARARLDMIPGLAEHGIPLKLVGDALRIRNEVIAKLERADHVDEPAIRRRLSRFAVVGGGFSGVEVAGEIHDFIHAAKPFYPNLVDAELGVAVVHAGERLLPELPPALQEKAAASMRRRGIELHLGAQAEAADGDGLDLAHADGTRRRLEAATIVATIGTAPNPLIQHLGLPQEGGRLKTRADLSVEGAEGVWALGDCALVPNAATSGPAPPTAQFAVRQARTLADNLRAAAGGRATRHFAFAGLGTIATIGSQRGVANVMGVTISGLPAWLLWRAFYLLQMPTLSRKVRIYVEWTWDMFFRSDIAQLDYVASAAGGEPEPARATDDAGDAAPRQHTRRHEAVTSIT